MITIRFNLESLIGRPDFKEKKNKLLIKRKSFWSQKEIRFNAAH